MQADRLQLQRFEIKYLVPETVALAARDFVRPYLTLDEFGATLPQFSYPVHSLYLDSNDLVFYRQTINGDKNRYKLRIRFYDDKPGSPAFLEIKKRTNNTISKQRCAVQREAIAQILAGQYPEANLIASESPDHLFSLQAFVQMVLMNRAKPTAHVAYIREAWISRVDNSVRVTMDRSVRFESEPESRISTKMKAPMLVFGKQVVLELKFTNRFPDWFKEFVRVFNLTQCSAAKYADGVVVFGEDRTKNETYFSPSRQVIPGWDSSELIKRKMA